jgi:hypothetical protein
MLYFSVLIMTVRAAGILHAALGAELMLAIARNTAQMLS